MRNIYIKSDVAAKTLFTWPATIIVVWILLIPIAVSIIFSFTNYDGISRFDFVGVDNYIKLFNSRDFLLLLWNSLYFFVIGVPLLTFVPLIFAVILYDVTIGSRFYKTVFVLPAMLSAAVVGILFRLIFSYNGVFNEILMTIGMGGNVIDWLAHRETSIPVIVIAVTWSTFGVHMLIFLAAMTAIPPEIYESAALDGAGKWRRLFSITIPMIKNTFELVVVLGIITILSGMFGYIFTITDGGPGYESSTFEYMLYLQGFRLNNLGLACAIAVILFAMMLAIRYIFTRLFRDKEVA